VNLTANYLANLATLLARQVTGDVLWTDTKYPKEIDYGKTKN